MNLNSHLKLVLINRKIPISTAKNSKVYQSLMNTYICISQSLLYQFLLNNATSISYRLFYKKNRYISALTVHVIYN